MSTGVPKLRVVPPTGTDSPPSGAAPPFAEDVGLGDRDNSDQGVVVPKAVRGLWLVISQSKLA